MRDQAGASGSGLGAPAGSAAPRRLPLHLLASALLAGSWGVCLQLRGSLDAFRWVLAVAAWATVVCAVSRDRRWLTAAAWGIGLAAVLVVGQVAYIGRTPLVVTYLSTVVACAAFARCRTGVRGASSRTGEPVAGLAVPLLVLSQVSWVRTTSVRLCVPLILVAYLTVELAQRRPAAYRRVEATARKGVAAIGNLVALAVLFVIAGAFLYLPGFVMRIARSVRDRGPVPADAAWEPYLATRHEELRESTHMFATTPRAVAVRRHLAAAGIVFVAIAVCTFAVTSLRDDGSPDRGVFRVPADDDASTPASTEPREEQPRRSLLAVEYSAAYSSLPAYRGVPWADELQAVERTKDPSPNPFYNLDDGLRRTKQPSECRCPSATVWFVGGSAAHGIGQRDDHTIASNLVELGEEAGWSLHVTNLAETGARFRAHLDMLKDRIAAVGPPDLVVFYNGFNEVAYEVAHRFAVADGAPASGTDPYTYLNERVDAFLASDVGPPAADAVVDLYRSVMDEVDRLADRFGFDTSYFFQADALVDPDQLIGYEDITGVSAREMQSSPLATALDRTARALEPRVHNLRPLFVRAPEPTFLGMVHQSEAGARIVAEAMFEQLRPQLEGLVRGPDGPS